MMDKMGYGLTKKSGLNFGKGKQTLLRSFMPKGKAPITIRKLEGDLVMYQCQSHQTSNLRSLYIMTTRQAHHHENQILVLAYL